MIFELFTKHLTQQFPLESAYKVVADSVSPCYKLVPAMKSAPIKIWLVDMRTEAMM